MAESTSEKSQILTAKEISAYVVCPEAWRLGYVDGKRPQINKSGRPDDEAKKEWLEEFAVLRLLVWGSKLIQFMILLIVITYIIAKSAAL